MRLEYRGERTTSPRGTVREEGEPVRFGFARFEPAGPWEVRYFVWAGEDAPGGPPGASAWAGAGARVARADRIDVEGYGAVVEGLPAENWGFEARSDVTLPEGDYLLRTIADDGIRVWVDGVLVVDDWAPGESRVRTAPLSGGRHRLRVRYYQVGGWVEARVEVVRAGRASP